ncbi:hypothetical protein K450DRAFT_197760 [Umbelopsis ramanniana AG]|uniref:Uncharacterized protein n=1 Tax=Umbelopsis ramanniana AG TaxID=1314678 RepID=A0AAD5HFP0_UMBRA|nr:uncharacterized protein K450DRAFT_197760 [Umbelopsis ramanniana AG]KAI8581309.1 hypothetical protein K450DRAFT_197760 [Umbelopsis ramanniana AG]
MLTQTAKSIFKKIEPLDGMSIRHAFTSRMAIRVHTPAFSLNVLTWPTHSAPPLTKASHQPVLHYRASVITGKKALGKSAVARNRARRRILSAAQHSFPDGAIPGNDYLFFAQPEAVNVPWSTLMAHMKNALEQVARRSQMKSSTKDIKKENAH